MANLSINLLPQELTAEKKQHQRSTTVVRICVVVLVLIIVAAGIVLSFRFSQNVQLNKTQSQISAVKQVINSPENSQKEGLVVTLDSRIDTLNKINATQYPAGYAFRLVAKMVPTNVAITAFTMDKKGKSQLQVHTADTSSLASILNNLLDPNQNENKITKASIQSINLDRTGQYDAIVVLNFTGGVK